MGGLLAGLASLAAPITARVLIALGFAVVTVTGVAAGWAQVKAGILSNIGGMVGAWVQLAAIGGVWVALGAMVGAMSFVVALWVATQSVRILGVAS